MSNMVCVWGREERAALPADSLKTTMAGYVDAGRCTGRYAGPARGESEETFEQNLARIFARAETPRLSGVQIKAPMSLMPDGALVPAIDQPFTHILKPAGTAGFETFPVVEWLCLGPGRPAGVGFPCAAPVELPGSMLPRHGRSEARRRWEG